MGTIQMTIRSQKNWASIEAAQAFVNILVSEGDFLLPEKFDDCEPERMVFDAGDLEKFLEVWISDIGWVFLKRQKPYLTWMVLRRWPEGTNRFNEIMAGFSERYFKAKKEERIARLLSGAKRIYSWGNMIHGYICHQEDWDAKNYLGSPTRIAGRTTSTGGLWLETGLPGIYWANIFSPLYVEFFGREKFQTVPAYHKEEFPDGGFLLLTAPSPLDYAVAEVRELEQEIINHLGREAFFEKKHRRKRCRAPKFTFA